MKRWGKRVYTVAADYNFGQISAAWVKKFVEENGGQVVATEFFPLDVDSFGSTIAKIQSAKPDIVMSILVGAAHLGFYRQWAGAGMVGKIPMASTTFGMGGIDFKILKPEESNGIVNCSAYFEGIETANNASFLLRLREYFGDQAPTMAEVPCATYEGMWLWAKGVSAAGSIDRQQVIDAFEKGLSMDGPSGRVTVDAQTHHCVRDVHIAQINDGRWKVLESVSQVPPSDTQSVCNLKETPNANTQHTIRL
jgi:urea transport system substrate-binding protein